MNPNREGVTDEVAWARQKKKKTAKPKQKLALAKTETASEDICDILDRYDFNRLHQKIMKAFDQKRAKKRL